LVCRNICERLDDKISASEGNYFVGKKYCRRCEIFLHYNGTFCPCCGMQLRTTPTNKEDRKKLRLKRKEKKSNTKENKTM
jgi:hypothetical protein